MLLWFCITTISHCFQRLVQAYYLLLDFRKACQSVLIRKIKFLAFSFITTTFPNTDNIPFPAHHKLPLKTNESQPIITRQLNLISWRKVILVCRDPDETLPQTKDWVIHWGKVQKSTWGCQWFCIMFFVFCIIIKTHALEKKYEKKDFLLFEQSQRHSCQKVTWTEIFVNSLKDIPKYKTRAIYEKHVLNYDEKDNLNISQDITENYNTSNAKNYLKDFLCHVITPIKKKYL